MSERSIPQDLDAVRGFLEVSTLKEGPAQRDRRAHEFTDDLALPLADHLTATARRVAPGAVAPLPAVGPNLLHLAEL